MKISPFKLGLVLVIVGMVWTAFIFDETEKKYDSILLKESNSFEVKTEFFGIDIGYSNYTCLNLQERRFLFKF